MRTVFEKAMEYFGVIADSRHTVIADNWHKVVADSR